MLFEADIDNPIIHDTDEFQKLESRVKEVDPYLHGIYLKDTRVVILRNGTRSFRYPAHPSIEWVVGRVKYMQERNL